MSELYDVPVKHPEGWQGYLESLEQREKLLRSVFHDREDAPETMTPAEETVWLRGELLQLSHMQADLTGAVRELAALVQDLAHPTDVEEGPADDFPCCTQVAAEPMVAEIRYVLAGPAKLPASFWPPIH